MTNLDLTNLDNSGWLFQNFMVIFDESSVIIMIISDDSADQADHGWRTPSWRKRWKSGRCARRLLGLSSYPVLHFWLFLLQYRSQDMLVSVLRFHLVTIDWLDLLSAQILMITSRCAVHLSIYHHHHLTIYKITTPSKVCTYLLIFASIFLVIVTLPLSLCLIIKVNSLVRTSPRSIPTANTIKGCARLRAGRHLPPWTDPWWRRQVSEPKLIGILCFVTVIVLRSLFEVPTALGRVPP